MKGLLRSVRILCHGDAGSALVAAIAVAVIGMMLATIVVSQAILVSQDSGSDRVRMVEVHGAEGAVDAVYATLETSTPCAWPPSGTQVVNTAPDKANVSAKITYWDASPTPVQLPCVAAVVTGTPAYAVITATTTTGGTVQRTMQSKVRLTPLNDASHSAAVFAANSIMTTNDFTVESVVPGSTADIWVDSGNVDCNSNVTVDGNLIVVSGTVSISNACRITGDLWTKGKLTVNSPQSGGLQTVGGNALVKANATIAGGTKIGGDLKIAGSLSTWGSGPIVGGTTKTGATDIPNYVPVKLPEINYDIPDWTARGFTVSDWSTAVKAQAQANGSTSTLATSTNPADRCQVAAPNWSLNGPLKSPTTPTVWDTRYCSQTKFANAVQLRLRSDLVIFAKDFYGTGGITVVSDDGVTAHKLWIIVPDPDAPPGNGTADCSKTVSGYTPGNIKFDSGWAIRPPITVFLYTPCTIETNNATTFYGQIYGGSVILRNTGTMWFVPTSVPGVVLPSTAVVTTSGFRVDIVYKREIKTP